MSARLNYEPIKHISWKGKTFTQLTTTILFNNTSNQTFIPKSAFFRALPLKIYRREIANPALASRCNIRTSIRIDEINRPNGYIVYSNPLSSSNIKNVNSGLGSILDLEITSDTTDLNTPFCNTPMKCINQAAYALRRVRSSGMAPKNNNKYYTDNSQYLKSKNRLFSQNQYNYLTSTSQVISGITQVCPKVSYKPNNAKFSQQGSVSSSALIARIKYDTLIKVGSSFKTPMNNITIQNSLAYSTPAEGILKKSGNPFPVKCTPMISKFSRLLRKCKPYIRNRV